MTADDILASARRTLDVEAGAILQQKPALGLDFVNMVHSLLARAPGRVICTGVGKSGHVSRKIASTLSSTGTPAFWLHPVDALHGDLGVVGHRDMILAVSHSGETREILEMVTAAKINGHVVGCICGTRGSSLSGLSIRSLIVPVEVEAWGRAPTASAAAMVAVGDALAVVLAELRGFSQSDYQATHPSGATGGSAPGPTG